MDTKLSFTRHFKKLKPQKIYLCHLGIPMGQALEQLDDTLIQFIKKQQMFFVGTAGSGGRVNISPKGMDSLRIINPKKVVWLNLTGSGNETAAHVLETNRITIMFCAFEGNPLILRLYGKATVIHPRDNEWDETISLFQDLPGKRQVFVIDIESVAGSCGFGVPLFEYKGNREDLIEWASGKTDSEIKSYWERKNQASIDGKPTHIFG